MAHALSFGNVMLYITAGSFIIMLVFNRVFKLDVFQGIKNFWTRGMDTAQVRTAKKVGLIILTMYLAWNVILLTMLNAYFMVLFSKIFVSDVGFVTISTVIAGLILYLSNKLSHKKDASTDLANKADKGNKETKSMISKISTIAVLLLIGTGYLYVLEWLFLPLFGDINLGIFYLSLVLFNSPVLLGLYKLANRIWDGRIVISRNMLPKMTKGIILTLAVPLAAIIGNHFGIVTDNVVFLFKAIVSAIFLFPNIILAKWPIRYTVEAIYVLGVHLKSRFMSFINKGEAKKELPPPVWLPGLNIYIPLYEEPIYLSSSEFMDDNPLVAAYNLLSYRPKKLQELLNKVEVDNENDFKNKPELAWLRDKIITAAKKEGLSASNWDYLRFCYRKEYRELLINLINGGLIFKDKTLSDLELKSKYNGTLQQVVKDVLDENKFQEVNSLMDDLIVTLVNTSDKEDAKIALDKKEFNVLRKQDNNPAIKELIKFANEYEVTIAPTIEAAVRVKDALTEYMAEYFGLDSNNQFIQDQVRRKLNILVVSNFNPGSTNIIGLEKIKQAQALCDDNGIQFYRDDTTKRNKAASQAAVAARGLLLPIWVNFDKGTRIDKTNARGFLRIMAEFMNQDVSVVFPRRDIASWKYSPHADVSRLGEMIFGGVVLQSEINVARPGHYGWGCFMRSEPTIKSSAMRRTIISEDLIMALMAQLSEAQYGGGEGRYIEDVLFLKQREVVPAQDANAKERWAGGWIGLLNTKFVQDWVFSKYFSWAEKDARLDRGNFYPRKILGIFIASIFPLVALLGYSPYVALPFAVVFALIGNFLPQAINMLAWSGMIKWVGLWEGTGRFIFKIFPRAAVYYTGLIMTYTRSAWDKMLHGVSTVFSTSPGESIRHSLTFFNNMPWAKDFNLFSKKNWRGRTIFAVVSVMAIEIAMLSYNMNINSFLSSVAGLAVAFGSFFMAILFNAPFGLTQSKALDKLSWWVGGIMGLFISTLLSIQMIINIPLPLFENITNLGSWAYYSLVGVITYVFGFQLKGLREKLGYPGNMKALRLISNASRGFWLGLALSLSVYLIPLPSTLYSTGVHQIDWPLVANITLGIISLGALLTQFKNWIEKNNLVKIISIITSIVIGTYLFTVFTGPFISFLSIQAGLSIYKLLTITGLALFTIFRMMYIHDEFKATVQRWNELSREAERIVKAQPSAQFITNPDLRDLQDALSKLDFAINDKAYILMRRALKNAEDAYVKLTSSPIKPGMPVSSSPILISNRFEKSVLSRNHFSSLRTTGALIRTEGISQKVFNEITGIEARRAQAPPAITSSPITIPVKSYINDASWLEDTTRILKSLVSEHGENIFKVLDYLNEHAQAGALTSLEGTTAYNEIIREYPSESQKSAYRESVNRGEWARLIPAGGDATRLGLGIAKILLDLKGLLSEESATDIEKAIEKALSKDEITPRQIEEINALKAERDNLKNISILGRILIQESRMFPKDILKKQTYIFCCSSGDENNIAEELKRYYDNSEYGFEKECFVLQPQGKNQMFSVKGSELYIKEGMLKAGGNGVPLIEASLRGKGYIISKDGTLEKLEISSLEYAKSRGVKYILQGTIGDLRAWGKDPRNDRFVSRVFDKLAKGEISAAAEYVKQNPDLPQKGGTVLYNPLTRELVFVEKLAMGRLLQKDEQGKEKINFLLQPLATFNHLFTQDAFHAIRDNNIPLYIRSEKDKDGNNVFFTELVGGDILTMLQAMGYNIVHVERPIQIKELKGTASLIPTIKIALEQDNDRGSSSPVGAVVRMYSQESRGYAGSPVVWKRVKGILFDMDKTLYDSFMLQKAYRDARVKFIALSKGLSGTSAEKEFDRAREILSQETKRYVPNSQIILALGLNLEDWEEFNIKEVNPRDYLVSDKRLQEVLLFLSRSYKLAVLTNNSGVQSQRTLQALGISGFFNVKLSRSDTGTFKPNLKAFLKVAEELALSPGDILSIGDRQDMDILPAIHIGMQGLLIRSLEDIYSLPNRIDSDSSSPVAPGIKAGRLSLGIRASNTKFELGLVNDNGKVVTNTPAEYWMDYIGKAYPETNRGVIDTLKVKISEFLESSGLSIADVRRIYVAWGGPVDYAEGLVTSTFLPGFNRYPLRKELREAFGKDNVIFVDHDVVSHLIGEMYSKKGVLYDRSDGMLINIGTGIGGAVLRGGRVLRILPYNYKGKQGEIICGLQLGRFMIFNAEGKVDFRPTKDGDFALVRKGETRATDILGGPASARRAVEKQVLTLSDDAKLDILGKRDNIIVRQEEYILDRINRLSSMGDAKAVHFIRENGLYIGELLNVSVEALGRPEIVVLGGWIGEHFGKGEIDDPLISSIAEVCDIPVKRSTVAMRELIAAAYVEETIGRVASSPVVIRLGNGAWWEKQENRVIFRPEAEVKYARLKRYLKGLFGDKVQAGYIKEMVHTQGVIRYQPYVKSPKSLQEEANKAIYAIYGDNFISSSSSPVEPVSCDKIIEAFKTNTLSWHENETQLIRHSYKIAMKNYLDKQFSAEATYIQHAASVALIVASLGGDALDIIIS
ncbi:MAG: ROK family protein, partial [Candidatus Omnitrophica bacterium]|nr:ROK family protein [Candidatus Omnitrophota bacterium]